MFLPVGSLYWECQCTQLAILAIHLDILLFTMGYRGHILVGHKKQTSESQREEIGFDTQTKDANVKMLTYKCLHFKITTYMNQFLQQKR